MCRAGAAGTHLHCVSCLEACRQLHCQAGAQRSMRLAQSELGSCRGMRERRCKRVAPSQSLAGGRMHGAWEWAGSSGRIAGKGPAHATLEPRAITLAGHAREADNTPPLQ